MANPTGSKKYPCTEHIVRDGDKTLGYFTAVKRKGEFQSEILATPPQWDIFEEEEGKYSEAEEDRLVYVACTRAKNLLIVNSYPTKHEISPCQMVTPFLDSVTELDTPGVTPLERHDELKITKSSFD